MHRIKRYRDIRSPCLVPLDGAKYSAPEPLTKIVILIDEIQFTISFVMFGGNLK